VRWIGGLPAGAVLWDIGANVGVYALYAARRGLTVLAFEPSAATLFALTRNIERNGLSDRVGAYPVAFAAATRLDALHMANTAPGHSMHSFGTRETVEGAIEGGFSQAAIGYALDDFMATFAPPPPAYVKLDVDGIEAAILTGARTTLSAHTREVLVEIDGAAKRSGGRDIRAALTQAGFAEVEGFAPEAARNRLFRRN
jgi:FkbM family methyltransferase